jgi:esterase/lipase
MPDVMLAIQKRNWLALLVSAATAQHAVQEAGKLAGFDPAQADAVKAIKKTQAAVLLLHGADDDLIPPRHNRVIYRAASGMSRLVLLEDSNHILSFSVENLDNPT